MTFKVNYHSLVNDKRKLAFCPNHFIKTDINFANETVLWVYESTRGRFSIYEKNPNDKEDSLFMVSILKCLAFEDPYEAVLCKLKWS